MDRLVFIIMGVCGSGKTTVGKRLSEELHCEFIEGDLLHSESNIEKMKAGVPLNDDDRLPWLQAIRHQIEIFQDKGQCVVITCSALKQMYRDVLACNNPKIVKFIHLHGSRDLLMERLQNRKGHFMNPKLLDSQLEILEKPAEALSIDISQSIEQIIYFILNYLSLIKGN